MQRRRTRSRVTRRQFVGGICFGVGASAVSQGLHRAWPVAAEEEATPATDTAVATPEAATYLPAVPGDPFVQPPVLRSEHGRLDVTLTAQLTPTVIGGREVISMTYNGQAPAPTLRLQPGDILGITLINQLDQPTNLHTHGLHVSPSGNSDNVLSHLMPGDRFQYEFAIPEDGISGLSIPGFYWYHPHVHGSTWLQVNGGMAGALIVDGGLEELPELRDLPDRLLVLQSTQYTSDGMMLEEKDHDAVDIYVNGQYIPEMSIGPGETQRWRLLNASAYTFMDLELDGHVWIQIAADGNALSAPWSRDTILLSPGERVDVLVQGGEPGQYALRSRAWGTDFQAQPEMPVATLVSSGDAVPVMTLPTFLRPFDDLRDATVDRVREVTFSEDADPFAVYIDGHSFDADRVDQTVTLGATEEWVIRNTSPEWHPFHIHVNDFQVISVNGEAIEPRSWEDTIPVPPNGEVVMRSRFLDFTGKYVYHCHILDHEDLGMMGLVEVIEPAEAADKTTP